MVSVRSPTDPLEVSGTGESFPVTVERGDRGVVHVSRVGRYVSEWEAQQVVIHITTSLFFLYHERKFLEGFTPLSDLLSTTLSSHGAYDILVSFSR